MKSNNNIDFSDVSDAIKKQSEEQKLKKHISYLALLKHRIIHIFSPIDIDLQGIKELKEKEESGAEIDKGSVNYLKDVLSECASEDFYHKKITDLHFIIAGKSVNSLVDPSTSEQDLLLDNRTILELTGERKDKTEELESFVAIKWT